MRFRITPSNREFFEDFTAVAENLVEVIDRLQDLLADTHHAGTHHRRVKELELRGDELTGQILRRLNSSFVTPFDREDIHNLAGTMDDVVDDVHHVSELIALTGIVDVIPELHEQVRILTTMASLVRDMFGRLERMQGLPVIVSQLLELERDGDGIYRRTIVRLFSGEFETLEVLKWKDIIESMEAAIDRVEDVADIVGSIVVKYA